tara:strand:+ start:360 stop:1712 length:1353 start_codon:yes stop_codon:yes gene_type:complete
MTEPIDRGLQEELDRQKAEEAASIGTPNWAGSNKLVADAAFVRNGVLYFAYELSSLFDGQPTWVVYEASGVNPNQYKGNWGADGAGNQRVGPRIGTEPDGLLIEGGNFELFTLGAGDPARGIDALSDDVDLIDLVDEGYRTLVDNYGFFFDEVNGEFPGMELLFSRLGQGLPVTVQDLQSAGIGANVSQLKLDYLNATIASKDSDNPFVYIVNGEEVVNQKYVDHYGKVEGLAEAALEELGFDAALFEKENKLFYKQLVNTLVKGNISSTMMTEFIGYVLGVEGYETPDDDALTNLFSSVAKSVKSEQFSTSSTLFANALDAESLAIRKIGIGNYNALSEDKKREIMLMYNDSVDAATNMLQAMFEEYYPEYAGKNLDYASVKGKYLNKWQGIFGEAPDEEDSNWSDQIGKPVAEASKAYMTHAYNTGNPFFNRSIATSINQSLGGVVIR